jgi:rhomboid protease GluP
MYLIQEISGGSKSTANLCRLGAKCDFFISQGEYWRFITATFLHIGFIHVLLNLVGLYIFGRLVEKEFSRNKYIVIYLFCGFSATVFSYWSGSAFMNKENITLLTCVEGLGAIGAGASGAIFGLLGSYASYLLVNRSVLGKHGKESLISIGVLIFINVAYGSYGGDVDQIAHIAGLVCGFGIGWLLSPAKQLLILPDELYEKSIIVSIKRNKLSLLFIVSFLFLIIIIFMAYYQRTQYLIELSQICRLEEWYTIK